MMSATHYSYKKKTTKPHTSQVLEEASVDSTMRAGLFLLFLLPCLLVSHALEVQASEGEETKRHDFLPSEKQPQDPDTQADLSNYQSSTNPDIWAELRTLRDMVVEQKVELRNIEGRLRETEMQAEEQKLDLLLTKTSLEELRRDHTTVEERLRTSETQVEKLKKLNMEQSKELSDLRARLDVSEKQVQELKKMNTELRADLENQTAELLSIEAQVVVSDSELQLLTRRMNDSQAQNTAQEVELTSLMNRMTTTERRVDSLIKEGAKVAFYAGLTGSGGVGPYNTPTVLKFSKVFTNVGNAYSPTTGFFTAPVKGLYYFRFTVCGHTDKGHMGVKLFHNGKSIMFNLQTRYNVYFEYLSNAVILELNAGDELHLVLPENHAIFDNVNNHSTFSGFLLFKI